MSLVSAVVLALPGAVAAPRWMALLGLALVLVIWASTFGLQVPLHERLEGCFDAAAHRTLVLSNWIRTAAWMARVPLDFGVTAAATRAG